ncbi:MAG: Arylsulfatase [bacterium ADurb.Bin429]|nr:MAG: Arylsulfatase [bacterium ADurb.Bin429]
MATTHRNILFLLTDDQRYDTIGALGNPAIATPNFDRMVARGTAFTRAGIFGGSCGAVCMPSRAMIHTGRTLYHIKDRGETIDPAHVTLGEYLGAHGYCTQGFGKWHNERAAFARSFQDGDEIFFGGMADHWNVPAYHYDSSGRYDARLPICPNPFYSNEVQYRSADHIPSGVHSSTLLADAAVRGMARLPADRPFFMYIAFLAPHDPRTMPERFRAMYDPAAMALPPNYSPVHPFDTGAMHGMRDEELAAYPRQEGEIRRHLAEYYGMITHLDFEIGRILDALEASERADDTLIVLAGDNGLAVGQHGLMGKQSLYEHSVRVPLLFAGPGVPHGQRREQFCYLSDIYPTLCEYAGLPVPASVEGRSLCADMVADAPGPRYRYHAYQHVQRAVRDDRFKLIEYAVNGDRHTQLFDLRADPWEQHNLAANPAMQNTLARLRAELERCRDQYDDHREGQGQAFWAGYAAQSSS